LTQPPKSDIHSILPLLNPTIFCFKISIKSEAEWRKKEKKEEKEDRKSKKLHYYNHNKTPLTTTKSQKLSPPQN
jgi:hypothetical protein